MGEDSKKSVSFAKTNSIRTESEKGLNDLTKRARTKSSITITVNMLIIFKLNFINDIINRIFFTENSS